MSDVKVKAIKVEELTLESIESPDMLRMLDIWSGWCAGAPAPAWPDVQLMDIPTLLIPFTACVDVIDGGKDFVYRYWGTGLTDLFGREETGTRLSEYPVASAQLILTGQLQAVLNDACPKIFVTTIAKDTGTFAHKYNLRLPVMDNPGEVTKVLSVCELERIGMGDHDDLEPYWNQEGRET